MLIFLKVKPNNQSLLLAGVVAQPIVTISGVFLGGFWDPLVLHIPLDLAAHFPGLANLPPVAELSR